MRNLKRALSLALASVMVLGMTVVGTGASYTDVTSKQNQEAIEVLQAVGIMVGDDNGNFNPDQKVTRNEMAVVMSNLMDYRAATYAGTSPFTDVPSWAEPYVAACWNNGITSGYTKTTYGGSDTVTTSQAALMLMKALGYFQYSSDFGSDWQFATIKQATKIDLFDDVDSGVREAMTRNDLAQLVLNALETPTVEAEKDGQDIAVNGVTISSNVKYNYITSKKDYAYAIDDVLSSNTDGTKLDGVTVELGEKLYNGDLKKSSTGDNFGRPGSTWTYKSAEIGKYADAADGEWTAKVTNKALYEAAGSNAYDSYTWSVYRNGDLVASDVKVDDNGKVTYNHAGRLAAFGDPQKISKTSNTERVRTSGEGVLTQVFVDNTNKTAVLTLVDTGVAKVTKVTQDGDNYELTLTYKTKVLNAKNTAITPDVKVTTDVKFAKDDVIVYNASAKSGEVETLALAKTVAGKVTAQKDKDYTTIDGTSYTYNYAYTDKAADFIREGLYNLDSGDNNPSIDKDATLYLDVYGYVVAFEGKTSTAEDYLFVKDIDVAYGDVSAKVVFYDGTQKTIDIDQVNGKDAKAAAENDVPAANNAFVKANTVYKYTAGSSSYDLEYVKPAAATTSNDSSISNKEPVVAGVVSDSQTVFVDVKNKKAWTGYKNVPNKTNANITVIKNDDNVAEIVFIYGSELGSSANADDFVIFKGTGYAATKDADKKTVYKFTGAYDVNGEARELYTASETVAKSIAKGLFLITKYDGSDYVQEIKACTALINNKVDLDGDGQKDFVAGAQASIYAIAAKNGVLSLNKAIDLQKDGKSTNDHDVFAYDNNTKFVVVSLKENNEDVDTLTVGSIDDVVSSADADASLKDLTGVYVMTVDNDSDKTPLAETVLVIVPYVK